MPLPANADGAIPSIETNSDLEFDLLNDEDDLLACALEKIEREHSIAIEAQEEYEVHRALEQSLSPEPEPRKSIPAQSLEAATIELKREDLLDDNFTGM